MFYYNQARRTMQQHQKASDWDSVHRQGGGRRSALRACSLSSSCATSRPQACAILFPATRLPTIIEAGPTSVHHSRNHSQHHTRKGN